MARHRRFTVFRPAQKRSRPFCIASCDRGADFSSSRRSPNVPREKISHRRDPRNRGWFTRFSISFSTRLLNTGVRRPRRTGGPAEEEFERGARFVYGVDRFKQVKSVSISRRDRARASVFRTRDGGRCYACFYFFRSYAIKIVI